MPLRGCNLNLALFKLLKRRQGRYSCSLYFYIAGIIPVFVLFDAKFLASLSKAARAGGEKALLFSLLLFLGTFFLVARFIFPFYSGGFCVSFRRPRAVQPDRTGL